MLDFGLAKGLADDGSIGAFTGFFLLCSGASTPQVQAIHDEIEREFQQFGRRPAHREGYNTGQRVLLDYGSFVAHIFSEQDRVYYDLERLWRSAKRLEIPEPGFAERRAR